MSTHEFVCVVCGVSLKGRRRHRRGDVIVATNAPPSGERKDCVCTTCAALPADSGGAE